MTTRYSLVTVREEDIGSSEGMLSCIHFVSLYLKPYGNIDPDNRYVCIIELVDEDLLHFRLINPQMETYSTMEEILTLKRHLFPAAEQLL